MTVTVVHRVENRRGQGPFGGGSCLPYRAWQENPGPFEDAGLCHWCAFYKHEGDAYRKEDHRFGFTSIEQAKSWFTRGERRKLMSHGFSLVGYMVPPGFVYRGHHQVVFARAFARKCVNSNCTTEEN